MADSPASPPTTSPVPGAFTPLRVERVVEETADARSLTFRPPVGFRYRPGQFSTFRVRIDGVTHERCYSLSSTPGLDDELRFTVKRVAGGVVSNWINDHVAPGDLIEVGPPTGLFVPGGEAGDITAFAAGSGITPVLSIVRVALAGGERLVRLFYANRDRHSVIFAAELDALAAAHPDRFALRHHLDDHDGPVTAATVAAELDGTPGAEYYLCGPPGFLDLVEGTLRAAGVEAGRIRIERFTAPDPPSPRPADEGSEPSLVSIEVDGRSGTVTHRPGTTLLQAGRELGLAPPFSCEAGNCGACMALVVEGTALMAHNNALTPAEVAEGWVLTCQASPASATVHVRYP